MGFTIDSHLTAVGANVVLIVVDDEFYALPLGAPTIILQRQSISTSYARETEACLPHPGNQDRR
jgi:hypothetical protein